MALVDHLRELREVIYPTLKPARPAANSAPEGFALAAICERRGVRHTLEETMRAAAAPSAMMKNMPSMVCLVLSFWVCKTPEFWNACISRNSFVFIVQYGFAYDAPRLKPCRNTPLHRPLPNWPTAWPRA